MNNSEYNTHTNQERYTAQKQYSSVEILDDLSKNIGYAEGIVYVLSERQGIDNAMAMSLEAARLFIKKASELVEDMTLNNKPNI
jgi:hypothetical protein